MIKKKKPKNSNSDFGEWNSLFKLEMKDTEAYLSFS